MAAGVNRCFIVISVMQLPLPLNAISIKQLFFQETSKGMWGTSCAWFVWKIETWMGYSHLWHDCCSSLIELGKVNATSLQSCIYYKMLRVDSLLHTCSFFLMISQFFQLTQNSWFTWIWLADPAVCLCYVSEVDWFSESAPSSTTVHGAGPCKHLACIR